MVIYLLPMVLKGKGGGARTLSPIVLVFSYRYGWVGEAEDVEVAASASGVSLFGPAVGP